MERKKLPFSSLDARRWISRAGVLAVLAILLPGAADAVLVPGGDFGGATPTFAGWAGDAVGTSLTDTELTADSLNYLLSDDPGGPASGSAKLADDVNAWELFLFRTIALPSNVAELSFEFEWMVTSGGIDVVQATLDGVDLFAAAGVDVLLFTASGTATVDVSAFASQSVVLEFLLQDGDLDEQDMLTIGNISYTTTTVSPIPAPAPGTGVLLVLGLIAFARSRRVRTMG